MNRMVLISIAVLCFLVSTSFALDLMGPPTADLKQDEWRVGVDYMYSNIDIEADGIPELDLVATTVEDVQVNKVFANIGTGLSDNLEVFLRIGGAGANPDEDDNSDNIAGYTGSGSGFAIGGGIKATLLESDNSKTKWGVLAQMSWSDLSFDTESYSIMGHTVSLSTDVSLIEAQFAFGPTVEISENFLLYGGPFLRILDGDADIKGTIDGASDTVSTDLEEDSMFGGYIGMQLDIKPASGEITNGAYLLCEAQFTRDGWGIGAGIGWKF